MYSVKTENGRADYYYYDEITWIVSFVAISWVAWLFIKQAIQTRKSIRKLPNQKIKRKSLKKVINAKNELSRRLLKKGVSDNINAIGVGEVNGENCIQVFINDENKEQLIDSSNDNIPNEYKGIPIVFVKMSTASFLGFEVQLNTPDSDMKNKGRFIVDGKPPAPIRDFQETIVGGISGANTNLNGQSGTIGYFCKKKSIIPRKSATYLLSNTHVFADLKNPEVDEHDIIVQPSPGEPARSEPIGELTNYSKIRLDNDVDKPNSIDAAIAKLWSGQKSENLIPMIGSVKGFVQKEDVKVGEFARKFGRTTGFTAGNVFSIHLDIWIKYDRTGQRAFFSNQILIEPNSDFEQFVDKGDSGSLVVDGEKYAIGLVFAGASGKLETETHLNSVKVEKTIENYGVANPISDVMKKMKIEFSNE